MRGGRTGRRGRPVAKVELMEQMRVMQARQEAMELGRHREPNLGDVSDPEEEGNEQEEEAAPESVEMKMLRFVLGSNSRPKPSLSTYDGNLSAEGLIDWIGKLDKYFHYEDVEEDKKVKLVVTRLKGHAALWWDNVQAEKKKKNNIVIQSWDRMVSKMRGKFLLKDYQLGLYKQMQNIRQRVLTVREYTEEFYKVNLRAGYIEDTSEKTVRYINALRMGIQEEMSMLSPSVIEEAYQYALKAKEKISRKQTFGRGKGIAKGRGQITGRGRIPVNRDEVGGSNQQYQAGKGHESRGGRPYQRGRGRGRGRESIYRCYTCNKLGHRSYEIL